MSKLKIPLFDKLRAGTEKIICAGCFFLILIHLVASYFPSERLWGLNLLYYFPSVPRWIIVGLAFLALVPKINRKLVDILAFLFSLVKNFLRPVNKHLKYALLSLLSFPLFWWFKERMYLLGDGNLRVSEIVAGMSVPFTEPLDFYLHAFLFKILKLNVSHIYALLSCLAGVVFVYLILLLADRMGESGEEKFFVFSVLVTMGANQLFFGYVESYTLMYVAVVAFFLFSWLYLQKRCGLWLPTFMFLLAVCLHLAGLTLLPSLIYLSFVKMRKNKSENKIILKLKKLMLLVFLFFLIGDGLWILKKIAPPSASLDSILLFPLGSLDKSLYSLFSFSHIVDVFNHQLLISPVGVVILFISIFFFGKRINLKSNMVIFLLLVSIPQLLFAMLLNPQLGYPRDWDLFAFTSWGYTILGVYLFLQLFRKLQLERVRYVTLALVCTALISTLPWIYVNATQNKAIERFGHILNLDVQRAALGHECLAYNYRRLGEKEKEVEEWKKAIQLSNKPRYIKNLGVVYVEIGEYKKAAQKLEEVLKLDDYDHLTHSDIGKVYVVLGENKKAKIHFQKAVDLEPDNPVYYENLGLFLLNSGLFEESIQVLKKALQIRPDFFPNWRNLGFAYANSGNYIEAIKHLQLYLDNAPAPEDQIQIKAMIEKLKKETRER